MGHLIRKIMTVQGAHGSVRRTYWVNPNAKSATQTEQQHTGVANDRGYRIATAKVDPRQRVKISYGWLWSKSTNEGVDHGMAAIAKVHGVPASIPNVPVKVKNHLGGANGMYLIWNPWGGNEIHVAKQGAHGAAASTVHEYGHFLDHHMHGDGKPTLGGLGTVRRTPELKGVMTAIHRSEAAKSLVKRHQENIERGNYRHIQASRYLLMQPELYARAYAQWIGLRSGSTHVQGGVHEMREAWGQYGYAAQWSDRDFAPIAREFDRMFARRGLLNTRSAHG